MWLYDHEARGLAFKKSYARLGKELRPVVIGAFFQRGPDHVIVDLRSCERALLAIPFFDKHIPRRLAKATDAEVVNKLFSAADNPRITPADIFDHCPVTCLDPNGLVERIKDLVADIEDPRERFRIAMQEMAALA